MKTALAFFLAFVPLLFFGIVFGTKWRFRWLCAALYVVIYLPFSLAGRFETSNHGGMDWRREWLPLGLAEPYRREWGIYRGRMLYGRTKTRLTYAGNLFWPLILLDNLVWHPTHKADLSKE